MAFIGYERVSKGVQNIDLQLDSLKNCGSVYLHQTTHVYPLKAL
jgi:hypothetical protein